MIEYDQRVLPLAKLLQILLKTEELLPKVRIRPAFAYFYILGWRLSPLFSTLIMICGSVLQGVLVFGLCTVNLWQQLLVVMQVAACISCCSRKPASCNPLLSLYPFPHATSS